MQTWNAMKHLWRIEKRDVWAFPNFDSQIYGLRIENTGLGFVEDGPESGAESEEFRWAQDVDPCEFNARTEAQWLELVEGWLADPLNDAAFSMRAWLMNSKDLEKEGICTRRGDLNLFEQCAETALLLNEEFMRSVELQNETSPAGRIKQFGIIVRFNETGVFDFSLWPQNKIQRAAFPRVLEQLQFLLDWFSPARDEAKIKQFTALRRRDEHSGGHLHQITVYYDPHPLSAHERAERANQLRETLHANFSPDEVNALLEQVSGSR